MDEVFKITIDEIDFERKHTLQLKQVLDLAVKENILTEIEAYDLAYRLLRRI